MLSFTQSPTLQRSAEPPGSRVDRTQRDVARYCVLPEDVVALDYLIGVVATDDSYTFVQYNATDRHKASAGTRVRVVDRINGFANELRLQGVSVETALCFAEASRKMVLWIRISLERCAELSLEALWLIGGRVRLNVTTGVLLVEVDDSTLEAHVLVDGRLEKRFGHVADDGPPTRTDPLSSVRDASVDDRSSEKRVIDDVRSTRTDFPCTEHERVRTEKEKRRSRLPIFSDHRQKRYKLRNRHKKQILRSAARISDEIPRCYRGTATSATAVFADCSPSLRGDLCASTDFVTDKPRVLPTREPATDDSVIETGRSASAETEIDDRVPETGRNAKCLVM